MAKKSKEIILDSDQQKVIKERLLSVGDYKVGLSLYNLIKSRYKIIYVVTHEEKRVIDNLKLISQLEGYELFSWDCNKGLLGISGMSVGKVSNVANEVNSIPTALLNHILEFAKNDNARMRMNDPALRQEGNIFVLLDFHIFLQKSTPELQRKFKEFAQIRSVSYIVIVAPTYCCPDTLEKLFTVVDYPFPSKEELGIILDEVKKDVIQHCPNALSVADKKRSDILNATSGMTLYEAENALALSLMKTRNFDISVILSEKRQVIRKEGILEFWDPRYTFDDIGGLGVLQDWFMKRKIAFSPEAREYGLPVPKGCLLTSSPGCGKSMTCDALSSLWEMPLLRLDIGSIFGSLLGESESRIRRALLTAEAIAPSILWVDEIEKGIGGVRSSNSTDGGVGNRIFSTLLTWMQEKTAPVFIICTANNVLEIPSEFLRPGRFDEIFYLDLPNYTQRIDVISKLLTRKNRDPMNFNLEAISTECNNYSPVEIEKAINNSLFNCFYDNKREVFTADIIASLRSFQPMYNARSEDIESMKVWAVGADGKGGNARLANSIAINEEANQQDQSSRGLDFSGLSL